MTIRISSTEEKTLVIDKARSDKVTSGRLKVTGIPVKGHLEYMGKTFPGDEVDMVYLDTKSLDKYLRSKGGQNDLAEDIVKKLLDHPMGRQD